MSKLTRADISVILHELGLKAPIDPDMVLFHLAREVLTLRRRVAQLEPAPPPSFAARIRGFIGLEARA